MMFDSFPYQKFGVAGGKVLEVSTAPMMPNDLPIPIDTREQMYKIVVALERNGLIAYDREWPFAAGMRLRADLVLEKQSLLRWLLEPLIAARNRSNG